MFTFDIIGHTTDWLFHKHFQPQNRSANATANDIAYIFSRECHLKAFIRAVETLALEQPWDDEALVDAVLEYWLDNLETVRDWQQTLKTATANHVLIIRIGSDRALRHELESLFQI